MWILSINGPQDQTKAEVDTSSWWNGTELPIVLPRWWNLHLNRQLDKRLVSKNTEWRPQWSVSLGYVIGKIKSERMDKSAIQSLQQNTKHLWEGRWRFFSFIIEIRAPNVFPKNMQLWSTTGKFKKATTAWGKLCFWRVEKSCTWGCTDHWASLFGHGALFLVLSMSSRVFVL